MFLGFFDDVLSVNTVFLDVLSGPFLIRSICGLIRFVVFVGRL